MSKLENLLKEFCPEGVEYKTVGDIATDIYRGSGITRDQIAAEGTPCVRYGEIYTTYGIWFDHCVSYTNKKLLTNPKYFEHGDILFAITGENVEDIAKCTAYTGHECCLAGGDIVVLKHNQNPKYLSYALSTSSARNQKGQGKIKSKVVHSSVPSIKKIVIPVPPLEVQQEIVRILDQFTQLTAKLTAELTAELTARKRQYEHYQARLVTFADNVQFLPLVQIAEIGTGSSNTNEELQDGKYPFFVRSQDVRRKNTYEYDETAIITSGDGVGVGKIFHYVEGKYALHQRAYRIHIIDDRVIPRFYYYYMKSTFLPYIEKASFHSSVTSIRRPMLNNFPVPLISLPEQHRIVAILDRFDALCNDLNSGLPAEITARQKQYEYYRDKLLTFPQKN